MSPNIKGKEIKEEKKENIDVEERKKEIGTE